MKLLSKFSITDYVTIIVAIAAIIAACYTTEIRIMIDNITTHWQFICFWGGIFLLLWRFTHIVLRNRIESKIEEKFKKMEQLNQQLIDGMNLNRERELMTTRILKDIFLPTVTDTEENREAVALMLYNAHHNSIDLEKWKMDEDVIKRLRRIHFEKERDKVDKTIPKIKP
jgi:hypothetical protein